MTDQFDIQRHLDTEAEDDAREAMDRLEDCKDKAGKRDERLVRLDTSHFFDPQNGEVLLQEGGEYRNLGHLPRLLSRAADEIEESALKQGYMPVEGGRFWSAAEQRLYVKNGGHYVLYSLNRRKRSSPRQPERRSAQK
ncbi:MAG TPA: hypothetical protein VK914_03820 [bacterium]|jgi:hypothetical protein|nr:hypothetical protein [bacterium]